MLSSSAGFLLQAILVRQITENQTHIIVEQERETNVVSTTNLRPQI